VLTDRDATMMNRAPGAGGGTVTIVMSHSMHEMVFTAAACTRCPPPAATSRLIRPGRTGRDHDPAGPATA